MSSRYSTNDAVERKGKSYRGCKRCKRARRKCTEEKPSCSYCARSAYDMEALFRFQSFNCDDGKASLTNKHFLVTPSGVPSASTSPVMTATPSLNESSPSSYRESAEPHQHPSLSPSTSWNEPPTEHEELNHRNPFTGFFGDDDDRSETVGPISSPLQPATISEIDVDGSYFNFFLSEISKCFPYVNLFPWTAATLFSTSNHHPALRQSVRAVAALIEDTESGAGPSRALLYLQDALHLLQGKIATVEIDEGVAISSFLLAHISIMLGEPADARKHLRGKLMALNELDPCRVSGQETVPLPLTNNPLTLLIYRMAMRIDFIASIACGLPPVLPPYFPFECADASVLHEFDGIYRNWIQHYAEKQSSSDKAEWAEAWFELDGLMHRTCHLIPASDLAQDKRPPYYSRDQDTLAMLIDDHSKWRERKVVRNADDMEHLAALVTHSELAAQTTPPWPEALPPFHPILPNVQPSLTQAEVANFLDYPTVHVSDYFFASRLDNWRAIELYIGLIQKPMWGTHDGRRFLCAVDLCRTHAALGAEKNFLNAEKACGLYLAGVVFGGPDMYSAESQWVLEQLEDIKLYCQVALTLIDHLKHVWKVKGSYWDAVRIRHSRFIN